MKIVDQIAKILVLIGALNWGLVALMGKNRGLFDLLPLPGGLIKTIFILVGVSSVYQIVKCFTSEKCCK